REATFVTPLDQQRLDDVACDIRPAQHPDHLGSLCSALAGDAHQNHPANGRITPSEVDRDPAPPLEERLDHHEAATPAQHADEVLGAVVAYGRPARPPTSPASTRSARWSASSGLVFGSSWAFASGVMPFPARL